MSRRHSSGKKKVMPEIPEMYGPLVESDCPHFTACGGCQYRTLPYVAQLKMKSDKLHALLDPVVTDASEGWFEGVIPSPDETGYRNKMEFSFGDEYKDGPLTLGLHRRGSFYDIVNVDECRIVDADIRMIRRTVLDCARQIREQTGLSYYHRKSHTGYFRHLLVRKAKATGQILVDIVTTSLSKADSLPCGSQLDDLSYVRQTDKLSSGCQTDGMSGRSQLDNFLTERLLALPLEGVITGILHTYNDSPADTITNEKTEILYGSDVIEEHLLGLKFRITPFSFFQTNSHGAEVLYDIARTYIGDTRDKTIFDLYSGTGTIAQVLAPVAGHVAGVEIVEEAVEAAKENARRNGLSNCDFLCGDVLKVIDSLTEKPDMIVLDPPREGIHPKAMPKILKFAPETILYIACKPQSLARDLVPLQMAGYRVERGCAVDLFPGTRHIETIVLLQKLNS